MKADKIQAESQDEIQILEQIDSFLTNSASALCFTAAVSVSATGMAFVL